MPVLSRRDFLASGAASLLAGAAHGQAREAPPNIVLILADDLGYGDVGCYGQKTLKTPNLDRLAREGMRCTDVYSGATVCAPSRCSLMTGLHGGHATVRGNASPEIPLRPGDITVAEVLKQAGYATAMFGKWGVGGPVTLGRPNTQGFDEFFGYLSQWHAHEYYPGHLWWNEVEYFLTENFGRARRVFTHDLFTDRALEYIEKNAGRPFFLYLPYTVPHANNELGRLTGDGMEVPDYGEFEKTDWPDPEKGFARQVQYLDRDVGRILDKLAELKLDRNTIVFFTSDNGPHEEGGHRVDFFDSNGPLRGKKRDLYEGGVRAPMLVRWPGKIEAGSISSQPWASWDVLPTCAELAGVPAPEGIDGISVVPALMGRPLPEREYLYWEFHERRFAQAVRMGRWKAVRLNPGEATELYDLEADLGETTNVAARHPEIVRRAETIFREARVDSPHWPVPAA